MIKPEVIIYDFDGVICDSVSIKTEAFVEIYKKYGPEIQSKVQEYHLINGGISRFQKFKYYESVLLKKEVSEIEVFELSKQFANLVKEKVIASSYIKGAYEFIKRNSYRKQFICTGTPEKEIREISERKSISSFFINQFGSPKTKTEIINIILSQTGVHKSNCIYFGDALTDYNAAKLCGIPFIGIQNKETIFPGETMIIKDFENLDL
jgi:HAD superfamily hydrolase (TIGR01549 family)